MSSAPKAKRRRARERHCVGPAAAAQAQAPRATRTTTNGLARLVARMKARTTTGFPASARSSLARPAGRALSVRRQAVFGYPTRYALCSSSLALPVPADPTATDPGAFSTCTRQLPPMSDKRQQRLAHFSHFYLRHSRPTLVKARRRTPSCAPVCRPGPMRSTSSISITWSTPGCACPIRCISCLLGLTGSTEYITMAPQAHGRQPVLASFTF